MWFGKIIGGFLGFLLGGPLGAIIGLFAGHYFDRGLRRTWTWQQMSAEQLSQAQEVFFKATFSVMGHVSKADGRISEREIQAAKQVMSRMGLNPAQRRRAQNLFTQGKETNFDLQGMLDELDTACRQQKMLLRMFIEIQVQAALADGNLGPNEKGILQTICSRLGFGGVDFDQLERMFRAESHYRSQQQSHRSQRGPSLDDAYAILGITKSASPPEIKRAYRKLMSEHHPDKLASKGLPEEMMKLATERTQEIQAAYDQIKESKGM